MRSLRRRVAIDAEGHSVIVVLRACPARQFVAGQSACTHAANAGRIVTLRECAACALIGVPAQKATEQNSTPIVTTETLRSGNVVKTVPCKGCAGNVRIKVG